MNYYPIYQHNQIAPYHALQPLPVFDAYEWIKGAQPEQTFILRDGPVKALPTAHKLWLDCWRDEGFITYEAVKASPAGLSSDLYDWRVHVTRTEKDL